MNSFLAKKVLSYICTAKHKRGHGIHSPFIYDLIRKVFIDKNPYSIYETIEARRNELRLDKRLIEVEDLGAGSMVIKSNKRLVQNIALSSLSPKKYAQLLHRIVKYFNAETVLEMGTSLGISGAYIAHAQPKAKFITLEGSQAIAAIAQETFKDTMARNAEIRIGNFSETLKPALEELQKIDVAFIDGNHQKTATLAYFEEIYPYCHENSVLIFDDICWSEDMYSAWQTIIADERVSQSINICKLGIVFFRKQVLKQDFRIKY